MVEPSARIRAFETEDDRRVQFMIGKANFGALAVANRQAYAHPLAISLWIGLSCLFIQRMGWWPKPEHGILGYLTPLPAFASIAVPIMFLIDWLNRPYFETLTQEALHQPDIADLKSYYSRSPSSGLWILDYGTTFVGFIALDASLDAESNDPVSPDKKVSKKKGTARIAVIRHFYVEEEYRGIGIEKDLLDYAVQHAFNSDSTVRTIKAADSPLVQHVRECLRSAGFQLQKHTKTVGVMGWKLGERTLERSEWEKAKE